MLFACSAKADRVFSEETLEKWGYQTTTIEESHDIQSIKNYGDQETKFYARFLLRKSDYATIKDATKALNKFNKDIENPDRAKDYTQAVQKGKVIYFITATSHYTCLEHQPRLIMLIKKHQEGNFDAN